MATIIINRSSEYFNKFRKIIIYIDGKEIGQVADGSTERFTIPEGKHTLQAKIDWCSSRKIEFEIRESEQLNFDLGAFKHAQRFAIMGLVFIAASYLLNWIIVKTPVWDVIYLGIAGLVLVYMIYWLSFNRKNYLRLTETGATEHGALVAS